MLQRGCCLNALTLLPPSKKAKVAANVSNAEAAMSTSSSSLSVTKAPEDDDLSHSAGSASRSVSSRFQAPHKRTLQATAENSALEDRLIASRTKSAAENLEREAEANAAKAAKKARSASVKQSAGKGRSHSSKSSATKSELSLDDFPGGEY